MRTGAVYDCTSFAASTARRISAAFSVSPFINAATICAISMLGQACDKPASFCSVEDDPRAADDRGHVKSRLMVVHRFKPLRRSRRRRSRRCELFGSGSRSRPFDSALRSRPMWTSTSAVIDLDASAPYSVQQLEARIDAARPLEEELEQPELCRTEMDLSFA